MAGRMTQPRLCGVFPTLFTAKSVKRGIVKLSPFQQLLKRQRVGKLKSRRRTVWGPQWEKVKGYRGVITGRTSMYTWLFFIVNM
jgi:hypothetical protein